MSTNRGSTHSCSKSPFAKSAHVGAVGSSCGLVSIINAIWGNLQTLCLLESPAHVWNSKCNFHSQSQVHFLPHPNICLHPLLVMMRLTIIYMMVHHHFLVQTASPILPCCNNHLIRPPSYATAFCHGFPALSNFSATFRWQRTFMYYNYPLPLKWVSWSLPR